jgi:hypothetical protein
VLQLTNKLPGRLTARLPEQLHSSTSWKAEQEEFLDRRTAEFPEQLNNRIYLTAEQQDFLDS